MGGSSGATRSDEMTTKPLADECVSSDCVAFPLQIRHGSQRSPRGLFAVQCPEGGWND